MKSWNPFVICLLIGLLVVACIPTAVEPAAPPLQDATATPEPEATEEGEEAEEEEEDAAEEETAQDDEEESPFINEEGGPVVLTGQVTYTNPFFTAGVAQPLVILEDQAGFVDRDLSYLMSPESQTLGQITSDFFTSPFSYTLALPIEPQGEFRDVDNDGEEEQGVQVFAVAYWTNAFGDPFLDERDLAGGGWSTAYASTRISEDFETDREIIGGKLLLYASDDAQSFPATWGEDGLIFTEDDTEMVDLPQGYTVVDLDTDPFTFDRAQEQDIDLIEPEGAALVDFSDLPYPEAFEGLVDKFRTEYAFTEYKDIDWDALLEEYMPLMEQAEEENDPELYRRALRDFAWDIPDGHVNGPFIAEEFQTNVAGGLGLNIRDVDDGRVIVTFVLEGGPAAEAGIEVGAEVIELNGMPVDEAVDNAVAYSAPFSTEHVRRLQKLRYAVRHPLGTEVDVTFQNPEAEEAETVTLEAVQEFETFNRSSFFAGSTGLELPVEFEVLDSGYGYVAVSSFFDNELLTVQLWERMIRDLNENEISGLIIDMRRNGGGSGNLADNMAAYFFDEQKVLGRTLYYDEASGEFQPNAKDDVFYLPAPELRYAGDVVVLVGPACSSACEFFSYDMTIDNRSVIVGHYPTGGLGGSVEDFDMPEDERIRFTIGRAVDADGNIHIEGIGVVPDVRVPVTEETLFAEGDPELDTAVAVLEGEVEVDLGDVEQEEAEEPETEEGEAEEGEAEEEEAEAEELEIVELDEIAIGDEITGALEAGIRHRYPISLEEGDVFDVLLSSDEFDTYLRLVDLDGNVLLENDDFATDTINSGLTRIEAPVDIVIYVEVGSFEDIGVGEYTLSVFDSTSEGGG